MSPAGHRGIEGHITQEKKFIRKKIYGVECVVVQKIGKVVLKNEQSNSDRGTYLTSQHESAIRPPNA